MPLASPRIVAGSETTVTMTAGKWADADSAAARYCAQFDRDSVRRGRATLSADDFTDLWVFDCVSRDP